MGVVVYPCQVVHSILSSHVWLHLWRWSPFCIGVPPFVHGSLDEGLDMGLQLNQAGIHLFVQKSVSVQPPEKFKAYCMWSLSWMSRREPMRLWVLCTCYATTQLWTRSKRLACHTLTRLSSISDLHLFVARIAHLIRARFSGTVIIAMKLYIYYGVSMISCQYEIHRMFNSLCHIVHTLTKWYIVHMDIWPTTNLY